MNLEDSECPALDTKGAEYENALTFIGKILQKSMRNEIFICIQSAVLFPTTELAGSQLRWQQLIRK